MVPPGPRAPPGMRPRADSTLTSRDACAHPWQGQRGRLHRCAHSSMAVPCPSLALPHRHSGTAAEVTCFRAQGLALGRCSGPAEGPPGHAQGQLGPQGPRPGPGRAALGLARTHAHSCTLTHTHTPNADTAGKVLVPRGAAQLGSPPPLLPSPQPFLPNSDESEPQ